MPVEHHALRVPGSVTREGALGAAARVRFLVLDVDGVCTDAKLLYTPDGVCKMFHSQDGIGIKSAMLGGMGVGVITGRNDPGVEARFTQMGVTEYMPGFEAKLEPLKQIAARHSLALEEIAYLGDDWIDLDPMRAVGMPMAVANARHEVKAEALYVTGTRGGDGAVREAVEFLFAARNDGVHLADFWTIVPASRLPE